LSLPVYIYSYCNYIQMAADGKRFEVSVCVRPDHCVSAAAAAAARHALTALLAARLQNLKEVP
jgi:hypothetical protein